MVEVLAREVGLCPFLDRAGDLLHARGAGIGGHHRPHRVGTIDEREQSAADDRPHHETHRHFPPKRPHVGDRQPRLTSQARPLPSRKARYRARIAADHAKCAAPLQHGHIVTTALAVDGRKRARKRSAGESNSPPLRDARSSDPCRSGARRMGCTAICEHGSGSKFNQLRRTGALRSGRALQASRLNRATLGSRY
jgi:hypothetical protein